MLISLFLFWLDQPGPGLEIGVNYFWISVGVYKMEKVSHRTGTGWKRKAGHRKATTGLEEYDAHTDLTCLYISYSDQRPQRE